MKRFLLIPFICLSACASHTGKKIPVAAAVPVGRPVSSTGLRISDQLSEYRIGRYVDARDPLVMHEGHPIYRIENSARWDLRPQNKVVLGKHDTIVRPSTSATDAAVVEANKQRAETRAITEQTAALNDRLAQLGEAVAQTAEIAKENLTLKRDVAALREQLDALDAKLREPRSVSPSPSPEDKW